MGKTYKDFKKDGKVTLDSPKTKQRVKFAPATKTEKPKKGKGSYDRKKTHDEDEESKSDDKRKYAKGEKSETKKRDLDNFRKEKGVSFIPDSKSKKTHDEDEESKDCWEGYKKRGTKKKGGKTVNNCVKESITKFVDAIMDNDPAKADKFLRQAVNEKLKQRIEQEMNTPLFRK